MRGLARDFRIALRSLLRQPWFFVIAVATLALGVGSVSSIYSVVDGVLLKPLPYPDAERILRIDRVQPPAAGPVSAPLLEDWREATRGSIAAMGAYTDATVNMTGDGEAQRLPAYRVTPEFWAVMGLAPAAGRYFGDAEEKANERVVVLGHGLWQRHFGGSASVVGARVVLNGEAHRVVGVVPERFLYPNDAQVYLPTHLPATQQDRGSNGLFVVARLKAGATVAQVEDVLAATNARLAEEFAGNHADLGARVSALPEQLQRRIRQPLLVLLGASAMVLLIACANLANLLLARGTQRQRELAVRAAIGAGRTNLVRAVLAEACVIAVVGGVFGILVAMAGVPLLLSLAPGLLPRHSVVDMDAGVVGVSLLVALATVLGFAMWPAIRAAATPPGIALQEEGRGGAGGRQRARARSLLVAAEVALSLTLLVGAGLMIESLRQLGRVDGGVDTEGVLTASIVVSTPPAGPGEDMMAWYARHTGVIGPRLDQVIARLGAIPGVEKVAVSDALPLSGLDNISSGITIPGREPATAADQPYANWRFVNPDFFDALGMRLTRGRALVAQDARPGEPPGRVLVNETFVRRYLPDVDPVGQRIRFFGDEPKEIVGVVSDARLHGIDSQVTGEVYMLHGQAPQNQFHLALKVRGEPMDYAEQLRQAVREIDPAIPVFDVRAMDGMVADTTRMRRFNMLLMGVFSGVALLLAAVGLYGVIAYSVAQRRHEIGIRLSLGAAPRAVTAMVLGQGMRLVAAGMAAGVVGAVMLGRLVASQLYGVSPAEPRVIAGVGLLLALAGLLACLVPAIRASRLPPMIALRNP